jgi:hypothetical protein
MSTLWFGYVKNGMTWYIGVSGALSLSMLMNMMQASVLLIVTRKRALDKVYQQVRSQLVELRIKLPELLLLEKHY